MTGVLGRLEQSDNWTIITVKHKEDVRMGSTRGDRWMVYGRNASPLSTDSLVTHATKKKTAVDKARDIAKSYRPAKLRIYNKTGDNYRQHDYE